MARANIIPKTTTVIYSNPDSVMDAWIEQDKDSDEYWLCLRRMRENNQCMTLRLNSEHVQKVMGVLAQERKREEVSGE